MTVYGQDDQVPNSHDADVDAAYEDSDPASDLAAGSGTDDPEYNETSHAADIDAGYDDNDE